MSVCHTPVAYCIETATIPLNIFYRRVARPVEFVCVKRYGNILTRASNASLGVL